MPYLICFAIVRHVLFSPTLGHRKGEETNVETALNSIELDTASMLEERKLPSAGAKYIVDPKVKGFNHTHLCAFDKVAFKEHELVECKGFIFLMGSEHAHYKMESVCYDGSRKEAHCAVRYATEGKLSCSTDVFGEPTAAWHKPKACKCCVPKYVGQSFQDAPETDIHDMANALRRLGTATTMMDYVLAKDENEKKTLDYFAEQSRANGAYEFLGLLTPHDRREWFAEKMTNAVNNGDNNAFGFALGVFKIILNTGDRLLHAAKVNDRAAAQNIVKKLGSFGGVTAKDGILVEDQDNKIALDYFITFGNVNAAVAMLAALEDGYRWEILEKTLAKSFENNDVEGFKFLVEAILSFWT